MIEILISFTIYYAEFDLLALDNSLFLFLFYFLVLNLTDFLKYLIAFYFLYFYLLYLLFLLLE